MGSGAAARAAAAGMRCALRSALRARQLARGGPDGAPDRVELGARMLALGITDGDDDAELWGRLWRADAFAQLGRIGACSAEIELLAPAVDRLRSPGPTWYLLRSRAAVAYGRGEFGRARKLATESARLAEHGHENMRTLTAALLIRVKRRWPRWTWPGPPARRGRSGDAAEASGLAVSAAALSERLGMLPLVRDARAGWFAGRFCGGRSADAAGI
jgi:hypothetical protein